MTVIRKKEDGDAEIMVDGHVENKNTDEAMDLCNKKVSTKTQTILSAKMRFKKQRLDEASNGREWNFVADGLQKLAEAAEIKQVGLEEASKLET